MELFEIGIIALVGISSYFSYKTGRSTGTVTAIVFLKEAKCLKPIDSIKGTEDWPDYLKSMYDNPRKYL